MPPPAAQPYPGAVGQPYVTGPQTQYVGQQGGVVLPQGATIVYAQDDVSQGLRQIFPGGGGF